VKSPDSSTLIKAVQTYRNSSSKRLSGDKLKEALDLLKRLNYLLPGKNLLDSSHEELERAKRDLLEAGTSEDKMNLLNRELETFYDISLKEGLISLNPMEKSLKIEALKILETEGISSEKTAENARRVAEWVGNLVEEGLQKGFLISPVSVPLSEIEKQSDFIDNAVSNLSSRWQALAERNRWLLDLLKIAIPVIIIILSIHFWFEGDNTIASRQREASTTGQAVHDLKLITALMCSEIYDEESMNRFREIKSIYELEMIFNHPMNTVDKAFTLIKVVPETESIILKHKETDALVLINPRHLLSLKEGRMKVIR